MTHDPESGVRLLGRSVEWSDGSENELLTIMRSAADRSSTSDELTASIRDWPTLYHLSPDRSNLLRPLALGPGMRVLDVGAGTGALTRYVADTGADVVALEGNLDRARVAAARCEGLPNVQVVCGMPDELEDPDGFDVVLLVGVLEYAGADMGGGSGPESFLARLRQLVRADGVLVVAIENQLGLKYLAGLPEDHLGRPWAGLEGYPGGVGVRTYSRRRLRELLTRAGLPEQRWLFPFPDYKLPTAVVAEPLYDRHDAPALVDQLLRNPVLERAHEAAPEFNTRLAHAELVRAGLGPDVANSFLVVAGGTADAADRVVDTAALAWSYDGHRRLPWRRERRVAVGERGLTVLARHLDGGPGDRRESWLAQETAAERPFVEGVTLEQQFLDAASRHDLDAVADVLVRWRRHLRGLLAPAPATGAGDTPFSPGAGAAALPPECLDVDLSNFVVDTDGETLVQVDTEWRVAGGVDDELVTARALRYLAERVVVTGAPLPWDPATTVDDLTRHLASMCGVTVTDDLHERWLSAEAELQALVRGASVEGLRGELARIGGATQNDVAVPATRRASTPPPPASTTPLPAPSLGRRLARRLGVGG